MLTRKQVLDRYYPEVRAWLIQIGAVLDRYDRAEPDGPEYADDATAEQQDPRLRDLQAALKVLASEERDADRARQLQLIYSEPVGPPAESQS